MKLNAPKKNTWLIAVILGVVGIVASFVKQKSDSGGLLNDGCQILNASINTYSLLNFQINFKIK